MREKPAVVVLGNLNLFHRNLVSWTSGCDGNYSIPESNLANIFLCENSLRTTFPDENIKTRAKHCGWETRTQDTNFTCGWIFSEERWPDPGPRSRTNSALNSLLFLLLLLLSISSASSLLSAARRLASDTAGGDCGRGRARCESPLCDWRETSPVLRHRGARRDTNLMVERRSNSQ